MKSYYQLIRKASYDFTAKNHFAPSVIHMSEEVYNYLLHEMYDNEWWALIRNRRIMGMKIVFDDNVYDFFLE